MNNTTLDRIDLNGRLVHYRVIKSRSTRKLKVRVGFNGVEVLQPPDRKWQDIEKFLRSNEGWINNQIERIELLRSIRKPVLKSSSEILYRGYLTSVRVQVSNGNTNKIILNNEGIVITHGIQSRTSSVKSFENWLRKQAKLEIYSILNMLSDNLGKKPGRVYVMGQRTKWGSCSSLQNLSFNWRLIMAPEYVLRYIVTHEFIHLMVPNHSQRFWLTLQSLCPEMNRAKRWLSSNKDQIMVDLSLVS